MAASHLFYATHLRYQHARLRHQKTSGFDLKFDRMSQMAGDLLARRVPQTIVMARINGLFSLTIRYRESAACRNRLHILTTFQHLAYHRAANLLQMAIINAGTNVHMDTDKFQSVFLHYRQRRRKIAMPDAVFAVFAPGVGFLAVAVTKARIHAQPDAMPRRNLTKLRQHIYRAGIDRNMQFTDARQRGGVNHIGGKNDIIRARLRIVARRQRTFDLPQ